MESRYTASNRMPFARCKINGKGEERTHLAKHHAKICRERERERERVCPAGALKSLLTEIDVRAQVRQGSYLHGARRRDDACSEM